MSRILYLETISLFRNWQDLRDLRDRVLFFLIASLNANGKVQIDFDVLRFSITVQSKG